LPILRPFDIFYGHLVHVEVTWYNFPRDGRLYQEKHGHAARNVARPTYVEAILSACRPWRVVARHKSVNTP
jgi:hypothetical protein